MSQKICHKCGYNFEDGDLVRAVIVTRYHKVNSEVLYALEQPTDCLEVGHLNCNTPKGAYEGD